MDQFTIFVVASFVVGIGLLLALGKWYPGTGAEQIDWKPTRSPELEVQLELDDIDQMLEAQNERRRRSGRPEISEDEVREQVAEEERWRKRTADRYRSFDDEES